ncbi:MAG TPA: hypothetical protein VKE93_00160 [Candidatus Angelobacter sp.]|nr:hypothetical protein [Candidatus Angelobacter sp.]
MNALQKTLAIIAMLILVSQTIRHAYLIWVEPRGSVLDKYDQPLKNEITGATSLDELLKRYEPIRKQVDAAKEELAKAGKPYGWQEGVEPYKSESALRAAIKDWEQQSKEIHQLRFYWLIGLVLYVLGLLSYSKFSRWLGLTLVVAGFAEFIYWTSPTFFGPGTREYDRLLINKFAFSLVSLALLLVVIRLNRIFANAQELPKP